MIFDMLSGNNLWQSLLSTLITLPLILIALSWHETAHGFVAYLCGDNTAYLQGRITLNPLKHIDPLGFLCMVLFGFGWAKPVPINPYRFKSHKWGTALTALAGPLTNGLLGALCTLCGAFALRGYILTESSFLSILFLAFYLAANINLMFMFFNLIPIPPFDGSRVASVLLPERWYFGLMRYERQIMFGLLIALFVLSRLGFSPFSALAKLCYNKLFELFYFGVSALF